MTLCLWVETSIPVSICPTSCFCPFPITVYGFSKSPSNENRWFSWWSIHNTTLFLLHFSTSSWILYLYICKWKILSREKCQTSQELLQCKQQQSQFKNSSEEQCQEFHSLTSNQIPQLLHASIIKEILQTSRLFIRSFTAQVSPTWTQATKQCRLVLAA